MPTLATGTRNNRVMHRRASGFTLIEVLIVVIIIGTISAVALLSINLVGDDRELKTEARRIMSLIEVAGDEATLQGREFGVELMHNSYRFVEYDGAENLWAEILGDDTLRLRTLPEDVELQLYLEDQRVLLDDDPKAFSDPDSTLGGIATETYSPHLLVYSSGEFTPFELHLLRDYDVERVIIKGDVFGAMEVGDEDTEFASDF